jgi:hypothetical protein
MRVRCLMCEARGDYVIVNGSEYADKCHYEVRIFAVKGGTGL